MVNEVYTNKIWNNCLNSVRKNDLLRAWLAGFDLQQRQDFSLHHQAHLTFCPVGTRVIYMTKNLKLTKHLHLIMMFIMLYLSALFTP